jgi:hypothetical protein
LANKALPAASCAAVVTVAVYCVPAARLTEGTNIAVVLLAITVPATAAPPVRLKVKLEVFSEELLIASENVADTDEFVATPVAAFDRRRRRIRGVNRGRKRQRLFYDPASAPGEAETSEQSRRKYGRKDF